MIQVFILDSAEVATGGVLKETMFVKISQNTPEKTYVRVFVNKIETPPHVFICQFLRNF